MLLPLDFEMYSAALYWFRIAVHTGSGSHYPYKFKYEVPIKHLTRLSSASVYEQVSSSLSWFTTSSFIIPSYQLMNHKISTHTCNQLQINQAQYKCNERRRHRVTCLGNKDLNQEKSSIHTNVKCAPYQSRINPVIHHNINTYISIPYTACKTSQNRCRTGSWSSIPFSE